VRTDLKDQCNADERCPRRLDGADPLFLPSAKMQQIWLVPPKIPNVTAFGILLFHASLNTHLGFFKGISNRNISVANLLP
jgi:hypothetical protein